MVDGWPDDPRAAELDRDALADVVRRASWGTAAPGRLRTGRKGAAVTRESAVRAAAARAKGPGDVRLNRDVREAV